MVDRYARAFKVSPGWLLTGEGIGPGGEEFNRPIRIVGYVGAGSEAHFYDGGQFAPEFAPMPRYGNFKPGDDVVAVVVRGDSLGSLFNGWTLFYSDVKDPADPSLLKKLCVVGLADERVLVKKLLKGSVPGRYNLESQTEGLIEDAEVVWAAEVRAMSPP
jgi:hypothetical protein